MKTAFYFKTREEFAKVWYLAEKLNAELYAKYKFRCHTFSVRSQYLGDPKKDRADSHIPKRVPTKKKFIGIIEGNKHQMKRSGADPVAMLEELNLSRVQHSDNSPKYTGPKSEYNTRIKSGTQLRMLASMFDKQFGVGTWRIQGPKKLLTKANAMEKETKDWGDGHMWRQKYPKGIPIKLVVHKEGVDIKKYIFKLALMI